MHQAKKVSLALKFRQNNMKFSIKLGKTGKNPNGLKLGAKRLVVRHKSLMEIVCKVKCLV